jgi:hypothetical protein
MRLRTLAIAAMLLSAAAAMSAQAQPMLSGNDLERCVPRSSSEMFCSGYVLGFSAGLDLADSLRGICMPKGVTAGQMLAVVRAYTRANPKDRHMPLEALVGIAYLDAWPCKPAR